MSVAAGPELLDYDDVIARFDPVLGLEVHVELSTATKMFCGCATAFGAEPNTQVCPVCLGLPGSLPVLNRAAVESAIRIGLALNCEIVPWCRFARKNYFYPDMPKNYQISQYDEPIAINGYLEAPLEDGTTWRVEIERAHMEEDTGKLTHLGSETGRIHGATTSLIDYNRAGVPLIEIVTKPIVGAGDQAPQIARAYVTALRDLLRALDVSDVRMDQGSMRCDANVSLMPKGTAEFGTRTETKNVNSLKSVEIAVRYEMQRQAAVLASGGRITQETRHFHESGYTSPGRTKETAQDYRYFPEPDLEPVAPSREWVEQLRDTIPELPWLSRKRIQEEWGISDEVMRDLVNAFVERKAGTLLGAYGRGGKLVAAVGLVWDHQAMYYLLSSRAQDAHSGSISLLLWTGIGRALERKLTFDFDGFSSPSTFSFLNGFGATLTQRLGVERHGTVYLLMRTLKRKLAPAQVFAPNL